MLKVDAFDATLTNAKLTNGGFFYDDIAINIAMVNVMEIAEFSDIKGNLNAEGGYNGQEVDSQGIQQGLALQKQLYGRLQ